jgi:hypothetical protein
MDSIRAQIHDKGRIKKAGAAMNKQVVTLAVTILSSVTCGATFLLALARRFAMVEIAASIVTGVQLYLLSSTVGDLIEGKTEGRKTKLAASLMLTGGVVAAFLFEKYA